MQVHSVEHDHVGSCEAPAQNTTLHEYSDHVRWQEIPVTAGPELDKLLAIVILILGSASLLGNSLALHYFVSTRRRDLSILLYLAICLCDILTVVLNLPICVSLLRDRTPGIFNNFEFCVFWEIISMTSTKVSLLLVMLLSVSRAVSIAFPFHKINKRFIICIPMVYTLLQLAYNAGMAHLAVFSFTADTPYCYRYYSTNSSSRDVEVANQILESLQSGLSPVVTFVSFLVCLVKLLYTAADCPVLSQQHNLHAAVTVTMFTGLFLICYIPYIILIILESIMFGYNSYQYPDPFFNSCFMFWYSWIVARVLFPTINSTIDPVLYYLRMTGFRAGFSHLKRRVMDIYGRRRRGFRRRRTRLKPSPISLNSIS